MTDTNVTELTDMDPTFYAVVHTAPKDRRFIYLGLRRYTESVKTMLDLLKGNNFKQVRVKIHEVNYGREQDTPSRLSPMPFPSLGV